jgi:hypothetical protein
MEKIMKNKDSTVCIPQVSRDKRIGSAFNSLFKIIWQSEEIEGEELVWDFKNDLFLHPFFLAPLAIYKDNCEKKIVLDNLNINLKAYLDNVCFEKTYDGTNIKEQELDGYLSRSYIPIVKFKCSGDNIDRIQEILQRIIEKQSRVDNSMNTPISHMLSELIDNIGEHSGSNFGYLFCQRVKKELYIVIADSGRTIYGSYVHTEKYIDKIGDDEAIAIKFANDGYSTKDRPEAENRGYGISKSREMVVEGLGGAFFMLSGTAFFRHNEDRINAVNIPDKYRWDGTIILIRIPLKAPDDFYFYNYVE